MEKYFESVDCKNIKEILYNSVKKREFDTFESLKLM